MVNRGEPLILLTSYNRPDYLLEKIEFFEARNRQFVISVDGHKNPQDHLAIRCAEIAKEYESKKNRNLKALRVSEKNLGCKKGMVSAIDWAFNFCESLIIVEDDIVITDNFLTYIDTLLLRFWNVDDVFLINGWSPLQITDDRRTIYRSRFFSPWGWGTWKNRWKLYDMDLKSWDPSEDVRNLAGLNSYSLNFLFARHMKDRFYACKNGYDTWDYQVLYSMWKFGKCSITPTFPLSANKGFDPRATHTKTIRRGKEHLFSINRLQETNNDWLSGLISFEYQNCVRDSQLDHNIDSELLGFKTQKNVINVLDYYFDLLLGQLRTKRQKAY